MNSKQLTNPRPAPTSHHPAAAWTTLLSASLAALLASSISAQTEPQVAVVRDEDKTVSLPMTIDKVWYRAERAKGLTGDLTITEDSLEFQSRKRGIVIPLDSIYAVTLGYQRGDVDNEWTLLGIRESGVDRIMGLRDGKRLGYGQDTRDIYVAVRRTLKQLGRGPYRTEPGLKLYDAFGRRATIQVPESWGATVPHAVMVEDRPADVTVLFSKASSSGDQQGEADHEAHLRRARHGELEGIFFYLSEIGKGMGCDGFKPKVETQLVAQAVEALQALSGYILEAEPQVAPIKLSGCDGLQITASSRDASGNRVQLDRRIVSRGDTLIVLESRARGNANARSQTFEQTVASLNLAPNFLR